jgi:hypothetical protein
MSLRAIATWQSQDGWYKWDCHAIARNDIVNLLSLAMTFGLLFLIHLLQFH